MRKFFFFKRLNIFLKLNINVSVSKVRAEGSCISMLFVWKGVSSSL